MYHRGVISNSAWYVERLAIGKTLVSNDFCGNATNMPDLTFTSNFDVRYSFIPPGALPLGLLIETMQFLLVPLFVFVAAPVAVSACEGECIIGITNAFLGNYSAPIQAVLNEIVTHTCIMIHSITNIR